MSTIADCLGHIINVLLRIQSAKDDPALLDELNGPGYGLCSTVPVMLQQLPLVESEVDRVMEMWWMRRDDAFRTWEEYSGWLSYPICTIAKVAPGELNTYREAWNQYNESPKMYGHGEYGDARLRLVDHMVTYFQDRLYREEQQQAEGVL